MTALNRALALAQVYAVAVFICEHLNLYVTWTFYVTFEIKVAVFESGLCFSRSCFKRRPKLIFRANDSHPASASARRSFDYDRITYLKRQSFCFFFGFERIWTAGQYRHARLLHRAPRLHLVAHHLNDAGARTDKFYIARLADFREVARLRQETVARMNCVSVVEFCGADNCRYVQIALSRRRRAYADVFVRKEHVKRIAVGCGMDSHSLNAHLLA